MFRSHSHPPPQSLARHLSWIWRLEGDVPAGTRTPILPDVASAQLVIQLGADCRLRRGFTWCELPRRVVVGAFGETRELEFDGAVHAIGLRLPIGCGCLLGCSPVRLREHVVSLAELSPALDAALARWSEGMSRKAFEVYALCEILDASVRPACDQLVQTAARALEEGRSVEEVSEELTLSRRQLTRRFQAATGLPPRQFMRQARFARAWQAAALAPDSSWAAVAADAGYADQPHLDRDFRAFAGAPPSRVFPDGSPVTATVEREPVMSQPFKAGPCDPG